MKIFERIAIKDEKMILSFLNGITGDHLDRMFQDHLDVDDKELEKCHDRIQFMFPLHEDSHMARCFPVVTPELVEQAKKSPTAIANIKAALERMKRFYGMGEHNDINKQRKWCRNYNHNLLRVTRIIRSLRLFGLEQEAKEFYEEARAIAIYYGISVETLRYWKKAYEDDVWQTLRD